MLGARYREACNLAFFQGGYQALIGRLPTYLAGTEDLVIWVQTSFTTNILGRGWRIQ